MKSLYLYIILLLLVCAACKDGALAPKEELPPATQEGKNTIGFLVDGKKWIPKGGFNFPAMNGYYEDNKHYFYLRANRKGIGVNQSFGIDMTKIEKIAEYRLINDDSNIISAFYYDEERGEFRTDSLYNGSLKITNLDVSGRIISGTFHFDAINDSGEIVEIRVGRFDLKY